jgi:hypothetical protein
MKTKNQTQFSDIFFFLHATVFLNTYKDTFFVFFSCHAGKTFVTTATKKQCRTQIADKIHRTGGNEPSQAQQRASSDPASLWMHADVNMHACRTRQTTLPHQQNLPVAWYENENVDAGQLENRGTAIHCREPVGNGTRDGQDQASG